MRRIGTGAKISAFAQRTDPDLSPHAADFQKKQLEILFTKFVLNL